jgi:hypothetical protein
MLRRRQKDKKRGMVVKKGGGKYHALSDYLMKSQNNVEQLTFKKIEEILGISLPNSAYNYKAWWNNTGHQHAETWTKAGFRTSLIELGLSVTFVRQ